MNSTTETKTATGAAIVRAALEARTVAEASQINDMITLHVGKRYERFIGDTANNLGPLTTRGNYDHKALEPLTNMHDAILERFACEKFGGDLSAVPYETPREAAAGLLGHLSREEQAALARVDIYESDPPTKESKRVTLAYRDRGCGIDNAYVSESIFRIGSRHKGASLWQQGAFGMGATTCYPNAKAVVLVTRRPPELLRAGEEDVITVAVAEWQQHQKGRGIYYLVSESVDENRDAAPLAVPAANVPEFEPGTYLALISYATGGFWTGRNDRDSLGFVINTRLWRPPLPVTLMNRIAKGDHPKTHQGRRLQFDTTPRGDRKTFTDVVPFRMNGATHHLPIEVYYFEGGPSGDVGSMRNFIAKGHSVLLLANGQAHKHWDQQVPDDVEAGATATINAAIRDWQKSSGGVGNDLVWETELEVVEMTKSDSESKPKKNKKKTASKGAQVAVLWRDNDYAEDWNGGTPGSIEAIEASILADERDEYKELAELGSAQVPTVVLNQDFSPLKKYEAERIKRHKEGTLDQARDRYAVGVGVGLLVLEERNRKLDKEGKERPIDTLAERVAVARAALALMPDFDKLVMEAGLESE